MKQQKHFKIRIICWIVVVAIFLVMCGEDESPEIRDFNKLEQAKVSFGNIEVATWMYQIQYLDENKNIDKLDATSYDMLVVEPGHNFNDFAYNTSYLVNNLKTKPNGEARLLLAYIDIGQAEDYRDYWGTDWIAPTSTNIGSPDFLLTIDPDGWSGNYPVAYWDTDWQDLWIGTNGIIEEIAAFGFDGVYLDWVEAYDDDKVRNTANKQKIDPENEMLLFIERIKKAGRKINSSFYVIAQNAPYLIDADPNFYKSIIDGIATEDTWFYGEGDADWEDSGAGDLSGGERHSEGYSTNERIAQNKKHLSLGIPVFTVDYCIDKDNAEFVYYESWKNGFIPIVTRVSLSDVTETSPFEWVH
jgi:cysteinyl-tRNA synthetase, unknown class